MSEVILVRIVQTCSACPSQWDAWDLDGNYWYLRYRHSRGTAERQPGPDWTTWELREPNISFRAGDGDADGAISLERFCERAGLNIHPDAVDAAVSVPERQTDARTGNGRRERQRRVQRRAGGCHD